VASKKQSHKTETCPASKQATFDRYVEDDERHFSQSNTSDLTIGDQITFYILSFIYLIDTWIEKNGYGEVVYEIKERRWVILIIIALLELLL